MTRLAFVFLCTAAVAGLALAGADGRPTPAGKKIFDDHCAKCHGPAGKGDGPEAKKLGFHPRDFTLGAFKCRCTISGKPPTDEDLHRTISAGMPGTPMVPVPELSKAERDAVIEYVKALSHAFASASPTCDVVPEPPEPTATMVEDGRQLYEKMQCAKCHGPAGRGDGPSARTLVDDWGQPIKPYNFVALKKFKCGNDDRDLFRTLMTGMTGSPMPSFAEALAFDTASLPEAEKRRAIDRRAWSVVAYLRSLAR